MILACDTQSIGSAHRQPHHHGRVSPEEVAHPQCLCGNVFVFRAFWLQEPAISRVRSSSQHAGSGHQSPGLWRHPEDESHRFNDVEHWTELAQMLEKAKFHGIFIADVLGMLSPLTGPVDPMLTGQAVMMYTRAPETRAPPRSLAPSGRSTSRCRSFRPWRPSRRALASA